MAEMAAAAAAAVMRYPSMTPKRPVVMEETVVMAEPELYETVPAAMAAQAGTQNRIPPIPARRVALAETGVMVVRRALAETAETGELLALAQIRQQQGALAATGVQAFPAATAVQGASRKLLARHPVQ